MDTKSHISSTTMSPPSWMPKVCSHSCYVKKNPNPTLLLIYTLTAFGCVPLFRPVLKQQCDDTRYHGTVFRSGLGLFSIIAVVKGWPDWGNPFIMFKNAARQRKTEWVGVWPHSTDGRLENFLCFLSCRSPVQQKSMFPKLLWKE